MSITESNDPFASILPTVHEAVRKSLLVNSLYEKLQSLPAGSFPFAPEFGKLRDVVALHIGDTRILFPEFTPHDEALHVVKLFQLADKLFGVAYQQLNASELFLLGCALYAHDWGMAVGQDEKEYLRHGGDQTLLRNTFTPLPDEVERLLTFVDAEGLQDRSGKAFPILSDNHLRLYVRLTHARRSGARVRAHFREHPAVGEALAHLCEGHWHDFATLNHRARISDRLVFVKQEKVKRMGAPCLATGTRSPLKGSSHGRHHPAFVPFDQATFDQKGQKLSGREVEDPILDHLESR